MKIGFMGTHGTGKSTHARRLAECLAIRCDSISVVSEVARRCPLPVNKDTSTEAQFWIFHSQIVAEIEAAARADVVICDRTVWDPLVYAQAAALDEMLDVCMIPAMAWMEQYDYLYWCRPAAGRLVSDGFRDTDPSWQQTIDQGFEDLISSYHIPVVELL